MRVSVEVNLGQRVKKRKEKSNKIIPKRVEKIKSAVEVRVRPEGLVVQI